MPRRILDDQIEYPESVIAKIAQELTSYVQILAAVHWPGMTLLSILMSYEDAMRKHIYDKVKLTVDLCDWDKELHYEPGQIDNPDYLEGPVGKMTVTMRIRDSGQTSRLMLYIKKMIIDDPQESIPGTGLDLDFAVPSREQHPPFNGYVPRHDSVDITVNGQRVGSAAGIFPFRLEQEGLEIIRAAAPPPPTAGDILIQDGRIMARNNVEWGSIQDALNALDTDRNTPGGNE